MEKLVVLALAAAAAAVLLAPPAFADDSGSTSTPTPPPIVSTGGAVTGTNHGSSCSGRSGQVQAPTSRTDPLWWAEENDWPANAPRTAPPASMGCSR
jgi:hypothetical protein